MAKLSELPRRRDAVLSGLLGLALIIGFYLVVLVLAVACVYVPGLLLINMKLNETDPIPSVMIALFFLIGVVIAVMMVWAVLPHRKEFTAPGCLLERTNHPRLFQELDDIAHALGERPPSEVYLTADVNAWVTDRGGILGLGGRRVLAVGLPTLSILSVSQLRALLAHEFGHYYAGDTRLGPLIYRTRLAMMRTLENMDSVAFVTYFIVVKLVWSAIKKILGAYLEFFLRTTYRISQEQESRADELACWIADSRALIDGLKRIHATSGAFVTFWDNEVSPVISAGYRPPVAAGFARYLEAPEVASRCRRTLEEKLQQLPAAYNLLSIANVSADYDSHPPLSDRIQHASAMPDRAEVPNDEPAMTLLGDVSAVELQLLGEVDPSLRNADLLHTVSWLEVAQLVVVPSWRRMVARVSAQCLAGLTAQTLPDAVDRLRDIGALIPSPRGMLLNVGQRAQRAGEVVEMALGLALLNDGWQVSVVPGQSFFQRGTETLNTMHLMDKIQAGEISREKWVEQCQALGIAELRLVDGRALQGRAI